MKKKYVVSIAIAIIIIVVGVSATSLNLVLNHNIQTNPSTQQNGTAVPTAPEGKHFSIDLNESVAVIPKSGP